MPVSHCAVVRPVSSQCCVLCPPHHRGETHRGDTQDTTGIPCGVQGRSQYFLLGGANLVRESLPRVPPKLKTPLSWSTIFWEGNKFT